MPLVWLNNADSEFPSVSSALDEPNGLLAAGGDLSAARLLKAYRAGIFPWYEDGQPILWWSPRPRAVLVPAEIHLSRSLKRSIRRQQFTLTVDQCFSTVISRCASMRAQQEGTWITDEMKQAYIGLHQQGHAHSVEIWQGDTLVGGLYGIAIGRMFFGESMFSDVSDASKVALLALCQMDVGLIDCQVVSEHLLSLGAKTIDRDEFCEHIKHLVEQDASQKWHNGAPRLASELL
ncbi:MAG: leucyl/phenylalanyl-tRNA--protein transferase [Pseudomonadales bacterium]